MRFQIHKGVDGAYRINALGRASNDSKWFVSVEDLEALGQLSRAIHRTISTHYREKREASGPKPTKRFVKLQRARARAKRETKKEETARIRTWVFGRAELETELVSPDGNPFPRCEMIFSNGDRCPLEATELHHVFGRVRVPQSERNCIALCRKCHRELTDNEPTAERCWEAVAGVLERLGFDAEARQADRRAAFCARRAAAPAAPRIQEAERLTWKGKP